jgi:rhomboid protease GluP
MDDLKSTENNDLQEVPRESRWKALARSFVPVKGFYVTPILLITNILIMVLMWITGSDVFLPSNEDLIAWGADLRPLTMNGQPWRLITSCFLHIGIIHLLLNMYALSSIGSLLEPILGSKRFLVIYLLCGLAASTTSIMWHENTISAGASGAIFGLYGVFTALLTTNLIDKEERSAQLSAIVPFIGYNLVFGLKGGIDNSAHIGGLLCGGILGYIVFFMLRKPDDKKLSGQLTVSATLLVISYAIAVYFLLPADMQKYYSAMDKFSELETKALAVYNLPQGTQNSVYISEVKKGISLWKEAETVLAEMQLLDLSESIRIRNGLLTDYTRLRLESYNIIYKAFSENTSVYDKEIEEYNNKIQNKIKQLETLE